MESEKVKSEIINRIKRFEENITIPQGFDASTIDEIIAENPQLMFYIAEFQVRKGISPLFQVETKLQIQYHNKDFDLNNVYAVTTVSDILSLISRFIGNYKTNLGVIVDSNLDIGSAFGEFKTKYSVMYPNFTRAQITGCSFDGKAIYKFDFTYRIGRVKLNLMESEIQSEVDRVAQLLFNKSMPAEAKAYLAHNYLATSIVYHGADAVSNLEKSYVHSAYGALITKKCVCQGIAEAFKRLMDKSGVPCDVVCGKIIGQEDYHAWNIINLDNEECYHIDTTWDISAGAPSLLYFGKNDAFFEKTRQWNREHNVKCQPKSNLFMVAKKYIIANKQTLLRQGISEKILCV